MSFLKFFLILITAILVKYLNAQTFAEEKFNSEEKVLSREFFNAGANDAPGHHKIALIHGTVRDDGTWRRNLGRQPEKFQGRYLEGEIVALGYTIQAGDRMNKFSEVKTVY